MAKEIYLCEEDVIKEICARYQAQIPLAFVIVKNQDAALLQAALKYCDSWSNAIKKAGLCPEAAWEHSEKYL